MHLRDVSPGHPGGLQSASDLGSVLIVGKRSPPMKNPFDVLRSKEDELSRVKQEVEALRITAKLLGEEPSSGEPRIEYRQVVKMP